jgi:hypothetical protein
MIADSRKNSLLALPGNFAAKRLFWLRILGTHIADNREFPTKFAVKTGLSGKTRRRRPVRADCVVRHDLRHSVDNGFHSGDSGIFRLFRGFAGVRVARKSAETV